MYYGKGKRFNVVIAVASLSLSSICAVGSDPVSLAGWGRGEGSFCNDET